MARKKFSRRNFLKLAGVSSVAIAASESALSHIVQASVPPLGLSQDDGNDSTSIGEEVRHRHYVSKEVVLYIKHDPNWLQRECFQVVSEDDVTEDQQITIGPLFDLIMIRLVEEEPESQDLRRLQRLRFDRSMPGIQFTNGDQLLTLFRLKWMDDLSAADFIHIFNARFARSGENQEAQLIRLMNRCEQEADLYPAVLNWYVGASTHEGFGTHGPGKRARPVSHSAMLTTTFANRMQYNLPVGRSESIVDVYILDTVPPKEQIAWAWTKWGDPDTLGQKTLGRFENIIKHVESWSGAMPTAAGANPPEVYQTAKALYIYAKEEEFAGTYEDHNGIKHWMVARSPEEDAQQADATRVPLRSISTPAEYAKYDTSDHGLFIAGIVHELAPSANLYVIETLNRFGVGTFLTLAQGFKMISDLRRANPNHKSIINCSFALAFPNIEEMIYNKYPRNSQIKSMFADLAALFDKNQDNGDGDESRVADHAEQVKQDTQALLQALVDSVTLREEATQFDALIVAATGNDSRRDIDQVVEPPRFPAQLSGVPGGRGRVVGVGALRHSGLFSGRLDIASYSNNPSKDAQNDFMAFGGDFDDTSGRGVVGIYINDFIGVTNANGLAEWAGTSFAAPVVAGSIAELCRGPQASPADAAQHIRESHSTRVPSVPDPNGIISYWVTMTQTP